MSNEMWELVKRPQGAKLLRGRWVYKVKRDAHGNAMRYKARFVVKGYMQRDGVDYDELYAPTARTASLQALLAFVAEHDLDLRQANIYRRLRTRRPQHGLQTEKGFVWPEAGATTVVRQAEREDG